MMEATTHNQLGRLIILLVYTTFMLFPCFICAQSTTTDSRLSQLLDSAEILKLKGHYDKAIALCNTIHSQSQLDNDWISYARSLVEKADILRFMYFYSQRQEILTQALNLLENSRDIAIENSINSQIFWSRYFICKSKILIDSNGSFYTYAQDSITKYFNYVSNNVSDVIDNPKEYAYVLNELGKFYSRNDSTRKAKSYYRNLLFVIENHLEKTDYLRGFYMYDLAVFYRDIADYERAVLFISIAKYIFDIPHINDINKSFQSEIVLANTLKDLGQNQESLMHYRNIIQLCEGNPDTNYENLILSYLNASYILLETNSVDSVILFGKKALSLNRKEDQFDELILSYSYLNLGQAYAKKNNLNLAELYFKKSIEQVKGTMGPKHYRTHAVFRQVGNYFEGIGNFDKALENYQEALVALFPGFDANEIYVDPPYGTFENIEVVFYILYDKAGGLYKRFLAKGNPRDLHAAFKLYQTGYSLLEELLNSNFMDESIIQVFQGFKTGFNLSIDCAFDLYALTNETDYYHAGFQFIEKSKYFLLSKALSNTLFKQKSDVSNKLFLTDRQITQEINAIKHTLNNKSMISSDGLLSLQNSLVEKLIAKDTLWLQIDNESTLENKPIIDSLILSIEDIQHNLMQKDEILIEYHWADNFIYALQIGAETFDVHKIKNTPELVRQINNYAGSVSDESEEMTSRDEFHKFIQSANFLYQQLLMPVLQNLDKNLTEKGPINQITIIPDGQLSYLPFESFLTEIPDTSTVTYWKLPYVLYDFTIRYAYSLNILKKNLAEKQKNKKPSLLAFSYSKALDDDIDIARKRFDEEIRYSAEELNSIKSWIKDGKFYEDTLATEKVFKNRASQFTLIHLALHGQADITDKYNSKLIFKDDETTEEDGELHAYELYNMDLSNTEMAVLSACETGIGQQTEGEGIFSIARGFSYAGCPSIFMSLWKVSDKMTAELMDYFYSNLAKGLPKDQAMRQAKITFIDQSDDYRAHPSNWAAFIALGNNSPIHFPFDYFKWYYSLIILIVLISIYYMLHYRKKKIVNPSN